MYFWGEVSIELSKYYQTLVSEHKTDAAQEFISLLQKFLNEFATFKTDIPMTMETEKVKTEVERTLDSVGDIEMPSFQVSILVHILRMSKFQNNETLRTLLRKLFFTEIKDFIPKILLQEMCPDCSAKCTSCG